jgi:ABC-2 type transport system ATP-binding protein
LTCPAALLRYSTNLANLETCAVIELIHLIKKFGDLAAVNDVTLTVPQGEFFVMLGPNAAGKTTTLKILAGLMKPTSGFARVCGFDVQAEPLETRRRLAYVPDFPFLYDKLTAWEFFRFIGQLFGINDGQIETNAEELIARFHLADFVHLPLESLSHGTRQRVAIMSALLHNPEVLVIDEPTVGLDPQHARVMKDMFKERSRAGMTLLMSTHELSVAEEMADRIGIVNGGKLIAVGTRDELHKLSGTSGPLEEAFLTLTAEAK